MLTNCYEKVAITSYRRKSTERYRCKQGSTLRLQCQRLPPDIIHIYAVIALSLIIFSAGWPLSATASSLTAADHQRMQPESLDYAEDDEIKTGDDDDDDEDNMGEYLLDHVAPTSLPENSEAEAVGDDGVSKTMPGPAMPQYMIDLYRKFASDRYSTPIANTVRSFTGVLTEDDVTRSEATGSDPDTVVEFLIVFNLSSVYRSEEIHLAELHLGDSLLFDSHLFPVPVRSRRLRVTVFEHYILATRDVTLADKTFKIGDKDDIKAELTFSVTDTVQRWVRHDQLHQQHASSLSSSVTSPTSNGGFRVRFEVMVDPNPSLTESLEQADGHLSSENQPQNQQPPLLVVFSDDRKRREAEERERHEIESHELEAIQTDAADLHSEVDAESVEGNTVDETDNEIDGNVSEDLTRRRRRKRRASYAKQEPLSGSDNQTTQTVSEDNAAAKLVNDFKPDGGNQFAVRNRGARRRVAGSQQRKPVEDRRRNAASKTTTSSGSRRNSCRRRPLYVDFAEIRWDRWIIAPKGYQAYECVGQCRFPLSDHLTPTKYALIKSLVNTVHGPSRAGPVCCIPTKLEPISILYVDERGTVTYKYRYDGMVVAECGCR